MPLPRFFQNVLITSDILIVLQFAASAHKNNIQAGLQLNSLRPSWVPVKWIETKLAPCQIDSEQLKLTETKLGSCQIDRDQAGLKSRTFYGTLTASKLGPCQIDRDQAGFLSN